MSNFQSHSMSTAKFLTVSTNILHKAFVEGSRTSAKAVFSAIFDGKRAGLITVKMEDDSESRFDVTLDHSEFRGKLNFGIFKSVLTHMLVQISDYVKSEKEVPVFTEEESGRVLFGLPGIFENKGDVNALVLGADMTSPGTVNLMLQFVDSDQFLRAADDGEQGESV
ncbi:MAG: hypothetical protein ACI9GW_002288 [Halieaceae bacterium]|jgi:hypothetical protein